MFLKSAVFTTILATCSIALSSSVLLAATEARTQFATTQTLKIPGSSLPPGRYSIRMVDHLQDRYVLQALDASGQPLGPLFLAIPDASLKKLALGKPAFWRTGDKDVAIRGIRLQGMDQGAAFVFAKEDAAALAQEVGSPVPAIDPASESRAALPAMSDTDRQMVTLWMLSTETVSPGAAKTLKATKYADTVLLASAKEPVRAPRQLPRTAGHFAEFLLLGSLSLAAGVSLFLTNKKFV